MAENGEEKKGVGLVGGTVALGAGVGTAAGASSYMFKRELDKDANKAIKEFSESFKGSGDKKGLADKLAEEFKAANAEPTDATAKAEWTKKQTEFVTEKLKTQKAAIAEEVSGAGEAITKAKAEYAAKAPKPVFDKSSVEKSAAKVFEEANAKPTPADASEIKAWMKKRFDAVGEASGFIGAGEMLDSSAEEIQAATKEWMEKNMPALGSDFQKAAEATGLKAAKLEEAGQRDLKKFFVKFTNKNKGQLAETVGIDLKALTKIQNPEELISEAMKTGSKISYKKAYDGYSKMIDNFAEAVKNSGVEGEARAVLDEMAGHLSVVQKEIKTNPVVAKMIEADEAFLKSTPHPDLPAENAWKASRAKAVETTVATESKMHAAELEAFTKGEKAAVDAAKKAEPLAGKIASAERVVEAAEGVGRKGFAMRPVAAFKGLSGGGKTAVIALGATALVGTGLLISKMRNAGNDEQKWTDRVASEGQSQGTAPAR